MRITFLGTGTSHGVPMIGCECETCRSTDPRDTRLRPSIFVETPDASILVDAGPDLRAQALRHRHLAASTRSSSRTATPITSSAWTTCGGSTR